MTRHQANLAILNKIEEIINKFPNLRFHQILWMLEIIERNNEHPETPIIDRFYEESTETYKKLEKYVESIKLINKL